MTDSLSYRRLLRLDGMPELMLAACLLRLAGRIFTLAIVLYVLARFDSPVLAGWVAFASLAPGLIVSSLAGAMLDRLGAAKAIVVDMAVSAALVLALALVDVAAAMTEPLLLALVALYSFTSPLGTAGVRVLIPRLVPPDALDRANALDTSSYALISVAGPAVADSAAPPELDYEFWLGPAPGRPYNAKRVHYLFRFFWDYSGGQMTNFGAHHLDIAQWGLGRDDSGPVEVEATATFNKDGWFEVAETSRIAYTYDDGVKLLCLQGQGKGRSVEFEGERGTIGVWRGGIEASDPEILKAAEGDGRTPLYVSGNHHQNWLDCIKSREKPICDVEIGHRSATVCHLGNIAIRAGRKIAWDPKAEAIVGDDQAAAMLSRPYRTPWKLAEPPARPTAGPRV